MIYSLDHPGPPSLLRRPWPMKVGGKFFSETHGDFFYKKRPAQPWEGKSTSWGPGEAQREVLFRWGTRASAGELGVPSSQLLNMAHL